MFTLTDRIDFRADTKSCPVWYIPESNAGDFHLVVTRILGNAPATSEDFRQLSEDFRTLPKMCADVSKTFEHFQLLKRRQCLRALISLEHNEGHKVIM